MSRFAYVGVLVFVLLGSGWLEVALRTRVYSRWRRLLLSLAPVVVVRQRRDTPRRDFDDREGPPAPEHDVFALRRERVRGGGLGCLLGELLEVPRL